MVSIEDVRVEVQVSTSITLPVCFVLLADVRVDVQSRYLFFRFICLADVEVEVSGQSIFWKCVWLPSRTQGLRSKVNKSVCDFVLLAEVLVPIEDVRVEILGQHFLSVSFC